MAIFIMTVLLLLRLQKMQPDPVTGEVPYRGVIDAATKIARSEGLAAFYTGYPTYYMRIAPHAMITLISMEYLNRLVSPYLQR